MSFLVNDKIFEAMASWLRWWILDSRVLYSKWLGGSNVDSAFHSPKVDQMSSRNFRELSDKK